MKHPATAAYNSKFQYPKLQALGVFGLCQLHAFTTYLRAHLSPSHFQIVVRSVVMVMGSAMVGALAVATFFGSTFIFGVLFEFLMTTI
jgi:hypothetical protein